MKNLKRILVVTLLLLTLVATALFTTGCGGSTKLGEIDVETVAYDGEKISWGYVENATKYILNINGSEYTALDTQIAHRTESDSVTVEITPVNSKGKEGDTITKTFTKLPTIEELYFDSNGTLSWDGVPGASAYIVKVNGKESEKITSTSYSNFELGKTNKISVRASSTDNSTFSYFSDEVMKTYLAPPTNVKYDGDKITWSGSSQASGYEVIINGVTAETVTNSSYFMYNADKTTFNLSMKAVGDGEDVFSSPESTSHKYVYLADVNVANVRVENGNLYWDPVNDATAYQIRIGSTEKTATKAEYKNLTTGVDNVIKIKPTATSKDKNVTYFSQWSESITIHILAAPIASWNGDYNLDGEEMNAFQWTSVLGEVSGYEVVIEYPNGTSESFPVSVDRNNFGYAFADTGDYKISVKAVAEEGSGVYESALSTPILVRRLAPPSANGANFITSNSKDITKGFTVALKDQGQNVTYSIFKEGIEIITKSKTSTITVTDLVNANTTTRQELTYQAQAIGLGKEELQNGQKVVILSSLSANNLEIKITVLETPALNAPNPIEGKTLKWTNVTGVTGYFVSGFGTGSIETNNYCNLSQIKTAGDYALKVCSLGDGGSVLPSQFSEAVRVRKLAAPTNVHVVNTGESEGTIEYEEVRGATGYSAFFNGSEEPFSVDAINNVKDYVTVTGVSIRLIAVADSYDDAEQIYCLTSEKSPAINLAVLQAPTFPTQPHDEKNLIWQPPKNAANYTAGYHIFSGSDRVYNGIYNSATFSLESFAPGTYTFYIQAVGDGTTWLNSDKSAPITITKLATPVVEIDAGATAYKWKGIAGAQRYIVRVNGNIVKDIEAGSGQDRWYSYELSPEVFTRVGTYTVTVTAVSEDVFTVDSNAATINQVVKQVATPTFTMSYSHEAVTAGGEIIVTAEAKDTNTRGFAFRVGGATSEVVQNSNVYKFPANTTMNYTASVVAVGGGFDANNNYYINSLSASEQGIRLLGTTGKCLLNASDELELGTVTSASNGYEVVIEVGDGKEDLKYSSHGDKPKVYIGDDIYDATYSPDGRLKPGTSYKVKVRALGNGATTITGDWKEFWITI